MRCSWNIWLGPSPRDKCHQAHTATCRWGRDWSDTPTIQGAEIASSPQELGHRPGAPSPRASLGNGPAATLILSFQHQNCHFRALGRW